MEKSYELMAFELVDDMFQDVKDKGGSPYIGHLIRVSKNLSNDTEKAAGLLHDIIEDTEVTADDLLSIGFTNDIVDIVCIVTRDTNETYNEFINRISLSGNISAIKLKLSDLEDNMNISRICNPKQKDFDRISKRYQPAYELLTTTLANMK